MFIEVPWFQETSPALNNFWLCTCIYMIQTIWFLFTGTVLTVLYWYDSIVLVWYLKKWPGFDSQPGSILSIYSKLSPVNDLFLKILKHIYLPYIFLQNIRSEHFFSYAASENIVHQNKFFNFSSNFLHFSCWFGYSSNNSILGYIYLQSWKLLIVNLQIKISPIMLSRQLNFGVLLAWKLFYVYYKGKNSTFL